MRAGEIADLVRSASPEEILRRAGQVATRRNAKLRELAKLSEEGERLTAAGFLLGLRRSDLARRPFSDKELSNIQNRYGLKRAQVDALREAAAGNVERLIEQWCGQVEATASQRAKQRTGLE